MAVMFTWDDLRVLRQAGQQPYLRMFVTTNPQFARTMTWVGCAAVYHKAGEPMPVELLDDLDVILDLGTCERAGLVWDLMQRKGVKPSRCQTWCPCSRSLSVQAIRCETAVAVDIWLSERDASKVAA